MTGVRPLGSWPRRAAAPAALALLLLAVPAAAQWTGNLPLEQEAGAQPAAAQQEPQPRQPPPGQQKPGEQKPPQEPPPPAPAPPGEPASPPPQSPPPEEPAPVTEPPAESPPGAEAGGTSGEADEALPPRTQEGFLPRLDVYFPEGDLDLRVSRLINKTFFEGQVKYNFVDGDITAFLRYRYYGYKRVTQLAVFDSIEFTDVEKFSSGDFDRVRGILVLLQWPHSYNHRTFALAEIDSIASNIESLRFNNDTINNYVRFGYQLGTPGDIRSNAIVGETRARSERLFTAVREFGPGDFGFTAAATYSFDFLNGDYQYVKLEAEALKRFDVSARTFLVGRLHGGTFVDERTVRDGPDLGPGDRLSIPRSELFRLEGRENLKGVDRRLRGTDELHTTWEYFFPWFLDQDRDFLRLQWQNWYWILYSGIGAVGFSRDVVTDYDAYIPDVGIGFESSFRLRHKYRFFLSGVVAQPLKGDGGVKARVSVKSYH